MIVTPDKIDARHSKGAILFGHETEGADIILGLLEMKDVYTDV